MAEYSGNIYGLTKECIDTYGLISQGDRVLLGVSGGKDSLSCLSVLKNLSCEYGFELGGVFVSYPMKTLPKETENYIKDQVPFYIWDPCYEGEVTCSMCSRVRRKSLLECAEKYGYNKIALAHNYEDNAETVMLNIFTGNKGLLLEPKRIYFEKYTLIRPFLFVSEKKIISFAERNGLPLCRNECSNLPECGRIKIREMLKEFSGKYPNIYKNIINTGKTI